MSNVKYTVVLAAGNGISIMSWGGLGGGGRESVRGAREARSRVNQLYGSTYGGCLLCYFGVRVGRGVVFGTKQKVKCFIGLLHGGLFSGCGLLHREPTGA